MTYGEDPTILAWELANEPENPGDFSGKVLQSWIAEMSHFIKDNAPNQLVTSGSQGFFGPSTLQYMYLNGNFSYDQKLYTAQMCTGADFLANHDETTAIDLPSFHLYPGESLPSPSPLTASIASARPRSHAPPLPSLALADSSLFSPMAQTTMPRSCAAGAPPPAIAPSSLHKSKPKSASTSQKRFSGSPSTWESSAR